MLEEQHSMSRASTITTQTSFTSPYGARWVVREVADPSTDNGRALIFASDESWRRVRRYPAHWRGLDAAALWALNWTR